MSREEQVTQLTDYMAKFIAHVAKKLPDDVIAKLQELREKEDSPLSKVIYDTMFRNQELAVALNRPSCQDTGVLQFWVKCGTKFPLIDDLEALLKEAVVKATFEAPLRHNSVETFDEYNTGKNVHRWFCILQLKILLHILLPFQRMLQPTSRIMHRDHLLLYQVLYIQWLLLHLQYFLFL